MSDIDLEQLRSWVGRTHDDGDLILARHAQLMAATLDRTDAAQLVDGTPLPALWHWLYFLEGRPARELGRDGHPARELGRDGHPARGGFLPPVPLANRMWAGGRVRFIAPLRIGSIVRKRASILAVEHKRGRSGDLIFVTVLHELSSPDGAPLLREEHDLVYKGAGAAPAPNATPDEPAPATVSRSLTPTSTLLFRYSALTFNGHRIHYDADYCRDVEGYRNLVIHGPLIATLLAGLAEEIGGPLRRFDYRCLAPAILGDTLALRAVRNDVGITMRATRDDGACCVRAEAEPA